MDMAPKKPKITMLEFDDEFNSQAQIKVIGLGGGGSNMVDSMIARGLEGVELLVANSDTQALMRSSAPHKIQIGRNITNGLGTGTNPAVGEQAAREAEAELREAITGADMVFIAAGLGGGTGTGSAPVIAEIARELGALTVAVVTKPFDFEGRTKMRNAEDGQRKLKEKVDTMITISNQQLLTIAGEKTTLVDAFEMSNEVLSQAVFSISDLLTLPGIVNLDFADIRTVMGMSGGAVMGIGIGKGESRAASAVKKAGQSPLLEKMAFDGATGVLINITGGDDMTLFEVDQAVKAVKKMADPDANIIFGAVTDKKLADDLKVTIIATGFPSDVSPRVVEELSNMNSFVNQGNAEAQEVSPAKKLFYQDDEPVEEEQVMVQAAEEQHVIEEEEYEAPVRKKRSFFSKLTEDYPGSEINEDLSEPAYMRKKTLLHD